MIASFIYLAITGNTINIISLSSLSIAIGMVVDDAIVVLENVTTHIERGSDPKQAAVHGTNEVAISVIASTLTMIAVFFPLTMVSGMSGVLFKQLGWMMCAIMFVSTVAALSLTPMLCSQLLRLQKRPSKMFKLFFTPIEKALDALDTGYAKMLNWAVRHRPVVIVGCIAFFVVSLLCAKGIGTEFFPAQDNARIAVQLELPIGTRKEIAQELSEKLTNQWLTKYKDIMKVCNYTVGQADSDNTWASMQDNGSHIISFNISLVDPGDRDISLEAVCDEMRQDLKGYPEFSTSISLPNSNSNVINDIFSEEREVICFRLLTAFKVFSSGRVTLFSISEALAPGYAVITMIVFVSMSGYKSIGNLDKEKRPKITTARKQREVIIGFLTAPSYKLISL